MPTAADLDQKTFAILAVNETDDTDAVFAGETKILNEKLAFCNDEGDLVTIPEDWLGRIKETPEAVKDLLMDCEFVIKLNAGPGEQDQEAFEATGLAWPTEVAEEDDEE